MFDIMDRVSYHAVYDDTILSALQFAHLNGFSGVQVADECPHLSFNRIGSTDREQLKAFSNKTGCNLSLHAPDEAVSFFITDDLLLEGIFNYYKALIAFAVEVGAHIITVHLGSPVLFRTDSIPEEPYPQQDRPVYHEALRLGIDRLINLVDGRLILCVENYKMDHETLQVLDRHIGAGDLFLCWDVAKNRGKPEVQEYFLQHLDSVKQVHLHDFWQREGKLVAIV